MSAFIGCTIGLMATHHSFRMPKLVRAEFNRKGDDIIITAESGHSLARFPGVKPVTVTAEEFDQRPRYDDVEKARWAFHKLGIEA